VCTGNGPNSLNTETSETSEFICYLCGNSIQRKPTDARMKLSMDHVPPRLFFPKELRKTEKLNLQRAPSHQKCNEGYRQDEEYFYHSLYPIVAKINPWMGDVIMRDFARKAKKPQTPAMLRKVFSSASLTTQGGIHLPSGMVEVILDECRLQRVAMKIALGVLFLAIGKYFTDRQIVDIRFCLSESEVVDMYRIAWQLSAMVAVDSKVFSYKYFYFADMGHHILSMLFWEAFMYCVTVRDGE